MLRSLTAKLVVGNLVGVLVALGAFAAIQTDQTIHQTNRQLDQILFDRFQRLARGSNGPGGPGGPNRPNPIGQEGGSNLGSGGPRSNPGSSGLGPIDSEPRGFGQGGPRRGPMQDGLPRNARIINLEGQVEWPPGETSALSQTLYDQTKREHRPIFGVIDSDGLPLRVMSAPIRTLDGRELIGQVAVEDTASRLVQGALRSALLTIVPAALIASLGIAWLTSRLVLKPIKRVAQTAEDVAADPERTDRLAVNSTDEVGQMMMALNAMMDRIQSSMAETERALENQKRFSSDAAHELRTPLAAILLNAENALHAAATPEERAEALVDIKRLGLHMNRLTDMLLTLARLDQSRTEIIAEPLKLASVIQEACEVAGCSEDMRITVNVGDAMVSANRDAFVQILRNLLENACAYTPSDGAISVQASNNGLEIHNSGSWIAKEHLPRLFDRFYRADPSRNRSSGGYGLGLAIVHSLATSMGFSVRVESSQALGTTFFIDFMRSSQNS